MRLLLLATLATATLCALLWTQRLKHSPGPVYNFTRTPYLSPNGDGRRDAAHFAFSLRAGTRLRGVSVVSSATGREVRRLAVGRGPRRRLSWDGTDDSGNSAADGRYRVRVELASGRQLTSPRVIVKDTRPPQARILHPGGRRGASVIRIRGGGHVLLKYVAHGRRAWLITKASRRPSERRTVSIGRHAIPLAPASTGTTSVRLEARDAAGNSGTARVRLLVGD